MDISSNEVKRIMNSKNINLIDLRSKTKYDLSTIRGAINISSNELLYNIDKYLKKDEEYYLFCDTGKASYKLSMLLNNCGYKTYSIKGGFNSFIL